MVFVQFGKVLGECGLAVRLLRDGCGNQVETQDFASHKQWGVYVVVALLRMEVWMVRTGDARFCVSTVRDGLKIEGLLQVVHRGRGETVVEWKIGGHMIMSAFFQL